MLLYRGHGLVGQGCDLGIATLRDLVAAVLMDHRQRAAGQVAEAIGEIGIVAADQRVVAEGAILSEDDFAQQEVAQGVGSHHLPDGFGTHNVAAALAHLVVFKQQPAVREDLFGQRHAARHQKRRPEDGMEARNLLADQVQVGGPKPFAIHCAHVADQCVEPHVEDVLSFHRQRDAPLE